MVLRLRLSLGLSLACLWSATNAVAAPPSGTHPRLFMTPTNVGGFKKNVAIKGTTAAALVAQCEDAIAKPQDYDSRGGSDGDNWPRTAVDCAFAYRATQDSKYLTAALKYWQAALDDDQVIGDRLGCVAGVDSNWMAAQGGAPPVILTVTHDAGYPIRWYGPDIALTYDWLFDAPGVGDALRGQTRTCLGAWVDWYSAMGYLHDEAGGNYNAGFVIAKVLAGIAIGNDGGADGHIWDQSGPLITSLIVGQGLAGSTRAFGTAAGPMVGGDWAEGWQYGPLSVLELAVATRALEENGVPLPDMDAWANTLPVRLTYATVPARTGSWAGGSFDGADSIYVPLNINMVDAVLAGPSSDIAAGWAAFIKQTQGKGAGDYVYNALAELRAVAPQEFQAQAPPPSLWYVARGTRAMYVRTAWDQGAYWGVFSSAPRLVADHQLSSASNFVLSRGADHVIVDVTNYGEEGSTLESNAIALDSTKATSNDTPSQPDSSKAELPWARGTADAVYAARSDLSNAYIYGDSTDIKYAQRAWVMLPEGEVVTIDRAHTAGAAQQMHIGFHANTGGGKLALSGSVATGPVGSSQVAIHAVTLSGGTPTVIPTPAGACSLSCDYPCGKCDAARFAVDKYAVEVPGPWAVAVHVIDALGAGEAQATTGSLNDDNYDPARQNAGVIGAAVYRANRQTFVVASSQQDGATASPLIYGIPAKAPSMHVVFDAPEDAGGKSAVSVVTQGDRCVLTIVAGPGFTGHPLMFTVGSAAEGCKLTEATDVRPASAPPGGEASGADATSANGEGDGGACGCTVPRDSSKSLIAVGAFAVLAAAIRLRRRSGRHARRIA